MKAAAWPFRSPLTMLEQWRDRADEAALRELLIMGFTVDLSFLERFAIPTARALGARVTVVGDAAQAVHDPVDVNAAGRTYQHGHAVCEGAFHPKLVVLLGDEDVWVAVGSGNPTLSGWSHNRELWTVAYGTTVVAPQMIADVADWLTELPDVVNMASWIAVVVRDIAQRMRPATIDSQTSGVRALGNLQQSLLAQLPRGPVDELRLAAPFYDARADAVKELLDRMNPSSVRLALQPNTAAIDGAALLRATESVASIDFIELSGNRTWHGKLIEWRTGAVTTGMTGSANITWPALKQTTARGGNCELVVLASHVESLFPDGDATTAEKVAHLQAPRQRTATSPSTPVLLGCQLANGFILVELAAPAKQTVTIQLSQSRGPDSWRDIGTVAPGQRTAHFLAPPGARAVRAVITAADYQSESAAVFVTDPNQVRGRQHATATPRLARVWAVAEIFTDPRLADRFTTDLQNLAEQTRHRAAVPAVSSGTPAPSRAKDGWTDWLDDSERMLGPELCRLIYPDRQRTATDTDALTVPIDEWALEEVDETALAEDEDEQVLDELEQEQQNRVPLVPDIRPDERRRYRRFAQRWVETVAGDDPPPVPLRVTVTALYLTLLAAGVWHKEDSWRQELRRLIGALLPDDDTFDHLPAEALTHLCSMLAVAMATLWEGAHLHGGREADVVATGAWRDCAEWVALADETLAGLLLLESTQPYAHVATSAGLEDTIALAKATRHNRYAEAISALTERHISINRDEQGVWHARSDGNPFTAAGMAATELRTVDDVVVVVARGRNHRVLIACVRQTMLLVDSRSRFAGWRRYELTPPRTPASLTQGTLGPPPGGSRSDRPPPEVSDINDTLNIDLAQLARDL